MEYSELSPPCFGRQSFEHKIVQLAPYAFDETNGLNQQSISQWDGFRHVGVAVMICKIIDTDIFKVWSHRDWVFLQQGLEKYFLLFRGIYRD